MASEYDPVLPLAEGEADEDLEAVRELFSEASRPYLASPLSWLAWAVVLPGAALLTPRALRDVGPPGVMLLWSFAILAAGLVEARGFLSKRHRRASTLASWVLRAQGNLSLVAVALSGLLLWLDAAWALPGLWLALLGHNFYAIGGLASHTLGRYGLLYQIAAVATLWPHGRPLEVFAAATAVVNIWMAWRVSRDRRSR